MDNGTDLKTSGLQKKKKKLNWFIPWIFLKMYSNMKTIMGVKMC